MHSDSNQFLLPMYEDTVGAARYDREQTERQSKLEQEFGMCFGRPCRIYLKSLDKPLEGRLFLVDEEGRFTVSGFKTSFSIAEIESYVRLD